MSIIGKMLKLFVEIIIIIIIINHKLIYRAFFFFKMISLYVRGSADKYILHCTTRSGVRYGADIKKYINIAYHVHWVFSF